MIRKVLFLCGANSARSQMAEGLLRHYYGAGFEAFSAGAKASFVHPLAIRAMADLGIDISKQRSKSVAEFNGAEMDSVITLCAADPNAVCVTFFGTTKEELRWDIPDPAAVAGTEEEQLAAFRQARDDIKGRIDKLVSTKA
ncbi:MAG: arsenate reductase ArsC [Chloroflexota bacterium]